MRGSMIGRKKNRPLPLADLLIKKTEEFGEVLIEPDMSVFNFDGVGTEHMSQIIRRRTVDRKKIRGVSLSELKTIQRRFCKIQGEGIAEWSSPKTALAFFIKLI